MIIRPQQPLALGISKPAARIELATFWLQARCSATKLNGLELQVQLQHALGVRSPCVSTSVSCERACAAPGDEQLSVMVWRLHRWS